MDIKNSNFYIQNMTNTRRVRNVYVDAKQWWRPTDQIVPDDASNNSHHHGIKYTTTSYPLRLRLCPTFCCHAWFCFIQIDQVQSLFLVKVWIQNLIQTRVSLLIVQKFDKLFRRQVWLLLRSTEIWNIICILYANMPFMLASESKLVQTGDNPFPSKTWSLFWLAVANNPLSSREVIVKKKKRSKWDMKIPQHNHFFSFIAQLIISWFNKL